MTHLASCRKAGCHVVRIGSVLVILLVAAIAVRRQRRVIVVHMTLAAGQLRVRPGQRERGVVVIEG